MKRSLLYVLSLAVAMVAANSCQPDDLWDGQDAGRVMMSLSGDIEQQAVTRASDNGFAADDQVGIWAVNYDGDTPGTLALTGNQATNVRFTFDGTSTWTPDYDIYYKDKNTKVDLYGIYPYSSAITSIEALPFEVQEDQSTVSSHGNMGGYEASDFLWAKREAVTPTPSAVQLLFQHRMSCVVVMLNEGTGFAAGEFASLSKAVLINNVKRNATINLATGTVTATGTVPARGTVPAAYEGGFRAIVVPQSVAAASSLFSITIGGTAYTYSEGATVTYVSGTQHNFAVTINKKPDGGYDVTVSTSISAWTNDNSSHDFTAKEYLVVNVGTPGTLGQILTDSGVKLETIQNVKLTGTINADDFRFMRESLPNLAGVNLKQATIEGVRARTNVPNGVWDEDYPADAIPQFAFAGKKSLTSVILSDSIKTIETGAFKGTSLTGALVIPEGVTEIAWDEELAQYWMGSGTFEGTKITSVSLPATLTTIGKDAFKDCNALVGQLVFPSSVTTIGETAFQGCTGLTGSLMLPRDLTTLGKGAFAGCSGFSGDLVLPTKIVSVEDAAFSGCRFGGTLVLHDGIIGIGPGAFYDCSFKGELVFPKYLSRIGESAFAYNLFSSFSPFPETLVTIEPSAFAYNPRMSGVITFPEEMTIIADNLFHGCNNLEGIVLPKFVTVIGQYSFTECFQLNSIVCKATNPPVIQSGAFDGVAKDNFAVEVPAESVNDYIYANGWQEFERIVAYQYFSVSRRLFRALNATESKTLLLRAESGASWSLESKPDWVTVSPTSGTGKTDVTVTVNALPGGADNRNGEVVFLLDGKDYRCNLAVEQYNYAYGDGSVINVQSHSKGNGVPIVFMGDCYDAKDIAHGDYMADTQAAIGYFFDIEPYKSYRDYFDIAIVFGKSEDSGVGTVNTIRDAKFGTQYSLTGGTLENDGVVAFQYAKLADANMDLTKALVVMVLNSTEYGGVTYMWNDGAAIAICPKSTDPYPYDFRGLVQHEAGGHGFGKLADEYIAVNAFIQACGGCGYPHLGEFLAGKANGWYKNLSETGDRNLVPWSHLIYHPSYANTVDVYEGGYFHTRGIFRSEPNSCMNNNIPYYSAISRQAIVERIMDYAGVPFNLEDFYANDAAALTTKASSQTLPTWSQVPSSSINPNHHYPVMKGDHPVL